ncbi:peptidoglycan DD-metalloendopeptidase family protein, partial [Chryseobacterium sp. MFBS3-17]|uniref:peptidoglycan DD-metalloendopeptidase family protein n=1 Tax=Chryseobacterium sp. MFBS3-17 TaxID=2886689 RepID=UPI001D0E0A62
DEGAHHEYYVTASSAGKIGGSSQTNVNVTNPGYKPKPREDSPKFPATSTSTVPEKPDSESKILDAYFVNGKNQKLTKAAVGNHVQVQIITRNMLGKHVQYKVWEYDTAKNDLVYESGRIEVKGDIINTSGFTLTQAIFDKGIDFGRLDPDSSSQNYFIEVLPLDVSAESQRFGVTPEALMTVETGKSAAVVRELKGEKIENIIDAYFAKKEYTKQTGEDAGTFEYKFAGNGNRTADNAQKENIAKAILGKPSVVALKDKKQYTTIEAIKAALTADVYNKDQKITFKTFKLGEDFKRVNSAPLEEKLYLVATTSMLDGKEATIIIKEKDGIIKGSAGAILPVLEITEEQMEQKNSSGEVQGTEKTEFKGTVQDGMVKIPIHLRPKSDDELKQWKDKLAKGKQDGTYTYTFENQTSLPNGSGDEKKRIAGIILNNAKNGLRGNPPIENGKTAYAEEIENALTKEKYAQGETITFVLYKKQEELLYLHVKSKGLKQHDKEFLKQEGAYFQIGGGKCPRCTEKITLQQIEELFGELSSHKAFRQEIVDSLNKYIFEKGREIHINTCLRKAHFFAQVGAETLGINPDWMVETDKFRYSASRCLGIFKERAKRLNAAGLLETYCNDNPQKRLLNYMYAHENGFGNGNGNEASGDGYLFRGRGLKQLTGRGNYRDASNILKETFSEEYIDLEANPDKVKEAKYAVLSAIAFWEKHEIWKTADNLKTSTDENIKKIRALVNPGLAGWSDAKKYFEKGLTVFKVNECQPVESSDNSVWHDPIDYSQRTYYNSSGVHKEQNGAFGPVRLYPDGKQKNHQGLDIFADINTPCKACLNGTIVSYKNEGANGYGNVLVLEVEGNDLRNAKRNYSHEFLLESEKGDGFDINADKFYLRYAHLESAVKTSGKVDVGDVICYSGDTGNAKGVPNPHLHFEIAMKPTGNGIGLTNRYNPAYFVRLKPIKKSEQDIVKNKRS